MSNSANSLSIFTNILTSPQQAYRDIQQSYSILFPLGLILILNTAAIILLYSNIDYQWFIEQLVEAEAGDLSKAEQDAMRQGMSMMSPGVMGAISAVTVAVIVFVVFALYSLYLVIVSSITNDGYQFKQWLSLVSWSSIPAIFGALASIIFILMSENGQISPASVNPLSLNELIFGLDGMKGAGKILASTDISIFWTIALLTIGYAQWTKKSFIKSFLIVILPYAAYYGISLSLL
ncbi:YIP1 family protein [Aliikangiella maris]|uniref:YIP1 family protein n=2 Tax=Aliikangiella maris TaxID=3162458 RepID=A0ABV3MMK9_9GAMM